jgi:hypothetical protein
MAAKFADSSKRKFDDAEDAGGPDNKRQDTVRCVPSC